MGRRAGNRSRDELAWGPQRTPNRGCSPSLARIAAALTRGTLVPDEHFDRFLPEPARLASPQFWSPLSVALRVARWLDQLRLAHVVDIGSGAGKLCVAAALASRSRFTGLEHRTSLIAAARTLAQDFGVAERVAFIDAPLASGAVPAADAYYLFNPFEENLHGPSDHIDEAVPLASAHYDRDVAIIEELLAAAPPGTCVILYNGFGGALPDDYDRLRHTGDPLRPLELWRKACPRTL